MREAFEEHLNNAESQVVRGRRRFPNITLAISAFVMSLSVTLINAFYAVRGSEITVLKPQSILIYRDGVAQRSVLIAAMPLTMVNTADSGHGDVVIDWTLALNGAETVFRWTSNATAVFSNGRKANDCPIDVQCTALPGLIILDKGDQLADLPGGSAKVFTPSFAITRSNCENKNAGCSRYVDFESAKKLLTKSRLRFTVTVHFVSDGQRIVICDVPQLSADTLNRTGWTSAECSSSSVQSDRWL